MQFRTSFSRGIIEKILEKKIKDATGAESWIDIRNLSITRSDVTGTTLTTEVQICFTDRELNKLITKLGL